MAALVAKADGLGQRPIADELGLPRSTVRNWLSRATRRAEDLRRVATVLAYRADPELPPIIPRHEPLADAVEALGCAASALIRQLGPIARPHELLVTAGLGRLLAPIPTG